MAAGLVCDVSAASRSCSRRSALSRGFNSVSRKRRSRAANRLSRHRLVRVETLSEKT